MKKSATEVVEAMVKYFNAHDLDSLYESITDDYRQSFNGVHGSEGREAARLADTRLYASFPDYRRVTLSLIADGYEVALEWRFLGTSITGKTVDCPMISRMCIVDGRISEARMYGDRTPIIAAMQP